MTSYVLVLTDGSFDQFIPEDQAVFSHGLTFTGRGYNAYGEERNENILHLAENFSNAAGPVDPLIGQLWWDNVGGALRVWDGATWVGVSIDEYVVGGVYPVVGVYPTDGTIDVIKNIAGATPLIDNALQDTSLNNHLTSPTAHSAPAITFVPSGSISGATAQLAVESVDTNITTHLNDATAAHAASAISFVPYLSITATNVQTAISQTNTNDDSVRTQVNTQQTNIDNHKNDTVDAHDASAISFIPGGSGLVSVNVQDAIDEIQGSAGTPGALATLQVRPSASQAIGTVFEVIEFDTIVHSTDGLNAQWNAGTYTYTAAFDQEVNIIFQLMVNIRNNAECFMEIRNGGTVLRNSRMTNFDNDAGASGVNISQQREIGVKARISSGNQIRFYSVINPGSGPFNTTQGVVVNCHAQIEIIRDLS